MKSREDEEEKKRRGGEEKMRGRYKNAREGKSPNAEGARVALTRGETSPSVVHS